MSRVAFSVIVLFVLSGWAGFDPSQAFALAPEKGLLLVAREKLPDPRFRDSAILLIQHDDQGTVGLIVNRTSRLPLSEVLAAESGFSGEGETLSYGGPIDPETFLVLVRASKNPPEPSERIADGLYLAGLEGLVSWQTEVGQEKAYRVFTGYAGWAAGQLVEELERNDWQVVAVDADNLFGGKVSTLWQRLRVD